MKPSWRLLVIVAGALVALIGVSLLGSRFPIEAEAYKARFESAASDPLGLQVRVRGRFAIAFAGDLVLVMHDVHVGNAAGAEVFSAERATVSLTLLPLLIKHRNIHRIELSRPRISVERGQDGVLNWARRAKPEGRVPLLAGTRLSIAEGVIRYKDDASGGVFEATDVNSDIRGIRWRPTRGAGILAGLSFRGRLQSKEIRTEAMSASEVSVVASARKGTVQFEPITMRLFGGKGLARLHAELSDSIPRYRLRCSLSEFRIAECLRTLSPDTIATGAMDLSANVSTSGRTSDEWARSLKGDVILRGRAIELRGRDLDKDFSKFESSQHLDLTDVGSIFFAGPLGMVATKGYDFARLIGHSEGGTQIRAIVSSWDVRGGALRAKDVAMATNKNRVALRGNLDFVHQRFDSVTVAVIDKDGCAKVRQELRGTFKEPELTKPTILGSLLGPAKKVVTSVVGLLPGGCDAFYAGSVKHPE